MNKTEADELALELKGLMPTMTNPQVVKVAAMIEPIERELARAAIDGYVERYGDFSVDAFREHLRLTRLRGHDPQQSVRQRNEAWEQGVADDQRALGRLSDLDRAAMIEAVIAEQERDNPFLATRLRKNPDPQTNRVLAGLVAARVRSRREDHGHG